MENENTVHEIPEPESAPIEPTNDIPEQENTNSEAVVSSDDVIEEIREDEKPAKIRVHQNVTMSHATFSPNSEAGETPETVSLPSDFGSEIYEALEKAPNINFDDNALTRAWAQSIRDGGMLNTFNEVYKDTLEDKDAAFEQEINSSTGKLAGSHPRFKSSDGENLKGERAVLRMRAHIGLGSMFRTPLWNSGIWITFKAPGEGDYLELHRQIIADKISLGRTSYGLAFANTSSYMMEKLLDFALDNVYQTNLKTTDDLRSLISSHDIPSIMWGIACTIWPNGFSYSRACITDPEKCQHVVSEKLNLTKLQWTNTRALTQWQVSHMMKTASNSVDKESVLRYQAENLKAQDRSITVLKDKEGETTFVLKVPSIEEYLHAGNVWISSIVDNVNRALGMNPNQDERDRYILDRGRASVMRQYTHWIKEIRFNNDSISDMETIENTLDALSASDDIRAAFLSEIEKYINQTAITVIGIPAYDCPKCGGAQDKDVKLPRHTNLIPLDIYQTFFILLVQKIQRIKAR